MGKKRTYSAELKSKVAIEAIKGAKEQQRYEVNLIFQQQIYMNGEI